ncbi:MAG: dihydrofolate reductase [Clostridia bacterium]|nr:dihydrofolate reductase [Clostridia bacterium]
MIIIAHASRNWGIGKDNDLMFRLPKDMKFFRETTSGGVVIMGRRTLESFPNQKPLPNRVNIVISRNPDFAPEGVTVAHSVEEAREIAKTYTDKKIFVIGGAAIYKAMLPYCDTALITKVFEDADADSFILDFDNAPDWELVSQSDDIDDNGHTIRFTEYRRK